MFLTEFEYRGEQWKAYLAASPIGEDRDVELLFVPGRAGERSPLYIASADAEILSVLADRAGQPAESAHLVRLLEHALGRGPVAEIGPGEEPDSAAPSARTVQQTTNSREEGRN